MGSTNVALQIPTIIGATPVTTIQKPAVTPSSSYQGAYDNPGAEIPELDPTSGNLIICMCQNLFMLTLKRKGKKRKGSNNIKER